MERPIHKIARVEEGSIAWELGLEPGDSILAVNGHGMQDIFDYHYYIDDEYIEVEVLTRDGETVLLEIEKEEDEDLGLEFVSSLMDQYHSCTNQCIFCFIDQMPPGMRETLYFKDDDSRLSFLQGNYITLTNMMEKDIERLVRYHLSPINISVHTTNPGLRCEMLHNRFAGDILDKIERFAAAGITMNSQIVLCKGINDGEELDRSIRELGSYLPFMESLSVVPVGLTKYREKLKKLELFGREDAKKVLNQIRGWQDHFRRTQGTTFVHASDEWFILAGEDFPDEAYYEGYGQLENGVGMMRLLIDEVRERLEELVGDERNREISIATAVLAYPTICRLAEEVRDKYPGITIHVYCIRNDFFGETITVSGLLTGQDIMAQLADKNLGEVLFLPENVLRAGEEILLDDVSLAQISDSLQVPVNIIQSEGRSFVDSIVFGQSLL